MLSLAELFSRVRNMDSWELFHDIFSFVCMLLDQRMAAQAGTSPAMNLALQPLHSHIRF